MFNPCRVVQQCLAKFLRWVLWRTLVSVPPSLPPVRVSVIWGWCGDVGDWARACSGVTGVPALFWLWCGGRWDSAVKVVTQAGGHVTRPGGLGVWAQYWHRYLQSSGAAGASGTTRPVAWWACQLLQYVMSYKYFQIVIRACYTVMV